MFDFLKRKKMDEPNKSDAPGAGSADTQNNSPKIEEKQNAGDGIAGGGGDISVKFVIPRFNFEGKEYLASELEAAATAKDAKALGVIERLIEQNSSVLEIVTPQ